MDRTRERALRLVREVRGRLAAVYGQRLRGVYPYGSFARGQGGEDSDIDVGVVLAGDVNRWQESRHTQRGTIRAPPPAR